MRSSYYKYFLSNVDNASIALRKQLLEECNLFAILELPSELLELVSNCCIIFEKGSSTKTLVL